MKSELLKILSIMIFTSIISGISTLQAQENKPVKPVISGTDGYIYEPDVAIMPKQNRIYKVIFDATKTTDNPSDLIIALNMAGAELNIFGGNNIPLSNVKLAIVFHGKAIDGILDNDQYKSKYGVENPNLPVIKELKKSGVEMFVCGQQLLFDNIDPKTLSKDVSIASDALIVLLTYQNDGYALLSF